LRTNTLSNYNIECYKTKSCSIEAACEPQYKYSYLICGDCAFSGFAALMPNDTCWHLSASFAFSAVLAVVADTLLPDAQHDFFKTPDLAASGVVTVFTFVAAAAFTAGDVFSAFVTVDGSACCASPMLIDAIITVKMQNIFFIIFSLFKNEVQKYKFISEFSQ
jgi:hypothetical protein